jgi:hypothetical protein
MEQAKAIAKLAIHIEIIKKQTRVETQKKNNVRNADLHSIDRMMPWLQNVET